MRIKVSGVPYIKPQKPLMRRENFYNYFVKKHLKAFIVPTQEFARHVHKPEGSVELYFSN
jgi:hypothetical protein